MIPIRKASRASILRPVRLRYMALDIPILRANKWVGGGRMSAEPDLLQAESGMFRGNPDITDQGVT